MTIELWRLAGAGSLALILAGCSGPTDTEAAENGTEDGIVRPDTNPYPSTYAPADSGVVFITNAHIYDGIGGEIVNGSVLVEAGRIAAIGDNLEAPANAEIIDADGRFVTPGVIDIHSHLGVYPSPGVNAHSDGNEATQPVTAEVWAEHSVWPHDPGFDAALAGGVTTLHILPGSANLFGGRGVTLRNVSARTVQGMKFPDAPYTLKMACGENPSRVYGNRGRSPATDMGNMAGYRDSWIRASHYRDDWNEYWDSAEAGEDASPPTQDLELDTLMGVLEGDILVQMHCYRGDQMAQVIDMSEEFGYQVTTFHHAVEAYKISDLLAENDICAAVWADWGGFKMEAYDSIRENLAFTHAAGACAMIHSDSDLGIQRLNQEIAKALADGRAAGLDISEAEAWAWLSSNPAKALGIAEETGSLEVGKRADLVMWSGNPYSTYTRADAVWIDGVMSFDRFDENLQPVRDFMIGQPGEGEE
ncbi:amidohydrolase [Maricaulis sp. D1M11]|uniref:amidohydrolase n=1 Tax=Maricaulis sp. D1M11 TaxID=3076117 RepID=UPI0039B38117